MNSYPDTASPTVFISYYEKASVQKLLAAQYLPLKGFWGICVRRKSTTLSITWRAALLVTMSFPAKFKFQHTVHAPARRIYNADSKLQYSTALCHHHYHYYPIFPFSFYTMKWSTLPITPPVMPTDFTAQTNNSHFKQPRFRKPFHRLSPQSFTMASTKEQWEKLLQYNMLVSQWWYLTIIFIVINNVTISLLSSGGVTTSKTMISNDIKAPHWHCNFYMILLHEKNIDHFIPDLFAWC